MLTGIKTYILHKAIIGIFCVLHELFHIFCCNSVCSLLCYLNTNFAPFIKYILYVVEMSIINWPQINSINCKEFHLEFLLVRNVVHFFQSDCNPHCVCFHMGKCSTLFRICNTSYILVI